METFAGANLSGAIPNLLSESNAGRRGMILMRWFVPAIIPALRGYRRGDFFADLGAGLTVGLIALPLAIGFGIASGVTPQQGLWTGIIASLVVALLGGSRFQVAGPTGAFVPILFSVVA